MASGLQEMVQDWTKKTCRSHANEVNRNPNTDFKAGPGSENPGIFVLLCGGRGRNFLASKTGYVNTL